MDGYSAALASWTEKELERLESVWVQAHKWAWGLPWTTTSDVFNLPSGTAGMEYLRLVRTTGGSYGGVGPEGGLRGGGRRAWCEEWARRG